MKSAPSAPQPAQPVRAAQLDPMTSKAVGLNAKRVAVIMDHSSVSSGAAATLLRGRGFDAIVASTAKAGLEKVLESPHDVALILFDPLLPDADGIDLLGRVKGHPDLAHIPLHIFTELDDELISEYYLRAGVDGILLKPLSPSSVHQLQSEPGSSLHSNRLAPAFKLVDSDFQTFVFPLIANHKNVLFVFLPTLFYRPWYAEDGFLVRFYRFYQQLLATRKVHVYCVTGDLPAAAAAGKQRFKLPFSLLCDPSLVVSRRYVGVIDFGSLSAAAERGKEKVEPSHRSLAPALGMVLLGPHREVLHKWTGSLTDLPMQPPFPDDVDDWLARCVEEVVGGRRGELSLEKTAGIPAPPPPTPTPCPSLPLPASATASGPRRTILVAEDSAMAGRVLCRRLEALGWAVHCVQNGLQALDVLKERSFDVLLTDLVMPGCSGLSLLRRVQANPKWRGMAVVVMTDLRDAQVVAQCQQQGARAVLSKPLDVEALRQLVGSLE